MVQAFEILEQLPLPLLLQTSQGEILHRNRCWREQLGDFLPAEVAGSYCPTPVRAAHPCPAAAPSLLEARSEALPKTQPTFPPASTLDPISREGTWQFLKFPLHIPGWERAGQLWAILAEDRTEQEKLCRELGAKNADLVQLNRLKDEFLACISHELKSPLTSVVGLARLLQEQELGSLNPRQAHYVDLIYQGGRQLMALVNDLLDLTRLEAGHLKLNPTPISVEGACQQAYRSIQEKYQGKTELPLPFSLDIEPGAESLIADGGRLQQILVHLLDNGVKFTRSGGNFGLRVNRWDTWIAFTVWDTGMGIPEECQHLLFQKFQQLENPLTRQFEGTGLGLVLARRLARAHGGDVSFLSQVGRGSQFTLLLPPRPLEEGAEGEGCQLLALIVEAVPQAIDNLAQQLAALGYCAAVARTGIEAVEKARQLGPAVIFLNPLLPLLSGWDVLTLLQADRQTQNIPTLVTAPAAERHRSEGRGARGFLSLPVGEEALRQSLAQLLPPRTKHLTVLCLQPLSSSFKEPGNSQLLGRLSQWNHRILQVEDLQQAERLAGLWQVDVLVFDGSMLSEPLTYLRALQNCPLLAPLPLVILDGPSAEAANQVGSLSVFPWLGPLSESGLCQFLQVLQIAAGTSNL